MSSVIEKVSGRGIPLVGNDIDTDRIIPARFLLCVTFDGLGESAFEDDRKQEGGSHPFDQEKFQGASVLIVNRNFGCGSSREHAPQALKRWGIKAIIGESFAEIFYGNCVSLGIPCLTMSAEQISELQKQVEGAPAEEVKINLSSGEVNVQGQTQKANLEAGAREQFLSGQWDALGQLLHDFEGVEKLGSSLPYLSNFGN